VFLGREVVLNVVEGELSIIKIFEKEW